MEARKIYIPLMIATGDGLGAMVLQKPELANNSIPPYVGILVVSLIFDLIVQAMAPVSKIVPLKVNERFTGFILGAVVYIVMGLMAAKGVPAS